MSERGGAAILGYYALSGYGIGVGELLLMDALYRALKQSAEIAAAAVVVDAIDAAAAKFYQHFGFVAFPSISGRLFLPMKAVAGLFREKELLKKRAIVNERILSSR